MKFKLVVKIARTGEQFTNWTNKMYKIARFYHGKLDGYYLDVYEGGAVFDNEQQADKVCFYLNDERVCDLRYEVKNV